MKKLAFSFIVLLLAISGVWYVILMRTTDAKSSYRFAEIRRGNVENVVSGTGTLSAVGTVEVGTQISGTIAKVFVDYNDKVRKGQHLAVLDTALSEAAVRDARADVERTRAQYEQVLAEYKRNLSLFEKGLISEREFISIRTNMAVTKASCQSAQAALDRAETNLKNATFRSPIDGTVIQRNIEEGQTVAAGLQAPTLFVIAEDLSHMEILGLVDESDISQIRVGQDVRFTVLAYPDETFFGTVRQIRLQPRTIQNVVNYTVVIDAKNERGLLLPGMTATVDFVVERAENVLLVPNAALHFQPPPELLAEFGKKHRERMGPPPGPIRHREQARPAGHGVLPGDRKHSPGPPPGMKPPPGTVLLWYLHGEGGLNAAMVRTGVTDGVTTEIAAVRGSAIREGMQVICGVSPRGSTRPEKQPSRRSRGFGPPGPPPPPF